MAANRACIGLAVSLLFLAVFSASGDEVNEAAELPQGVKACADWMAKRTSADGAKVRLIGDSTLCADMPTLSDDAVNDFVEKISLLQEDAHPDVVIRSAGGRVDLGMTMGEAIQRQRASVYAFGFCGSSCANYVFLPASRRVILKDTLLVFHGGLYRSILDSRDLTEEGKERTVASLSRQDLLLRRAGVDPEFFEWIERLNQDRKWTSARCPGTQSVRSIVFSSRELAAHGATVDHDYGPQTRTELDVLTKKYGIDGETCYWQ